MGRPSKLTESQWEEVKRRRLNGETYDALAREFKISKQAIIKKLGERIVTVKAVANQLVSALDNIGKLPAVDQLSALTLADELRAISTHAAGAAKYGMATAHRLAGIAHGLVQRIDDADPMNSMDELRAVAAIGKVANDQAHIGLNLLAANKGKVAEDGSNVPQGLDFFYGGN
jgi:hypothetical protein